ncbi:MAG: aspartate-semialdehyde dehydrogenase [Alicyclobacillus sp.]|nr:aspartate-semialdehyde dehydrogenase [Alicyclobacillus sp.]
MKHKDAYTVAVLGATGAVGRRMVETLERRNFPVGELRALASPRSAGTRLAFRGAEVEVQAVSEAAFAGVDIALFSAGASTSLEWAPRAVRQGAVVIDNSSAYRMDPDVPLVVPEVNAQAALGHSGVIANPNCSTIQLMVALHPLRRFGLEHVSISTYQAVSGMGQTAVDALRQEIERGDGEPTVFPVVHQDRHVPMAWNVIPQCDVFVDAGYTKEEMKLVWESKKILDLPGLKVSPTAVRVPVLYGHAESVAVRFQRPVTPGQVREILQSAPGVVVMDDPSRAQYPYPRMAEGTGETFVGRIRQDLWDDHTVLMFIVADNLLKGAAYNAVQIAEVLVNPAQA